jgi:hypothetical protein
MCEASYLLLCAHKRMTWKHNATPQCIIVYVEDNIVSQFGNGDQP